ncbi:hypothetical protein [Haloechinothrix salitolerans]|uniref:Uncharacterized protein n=1 Tax=Haloechinothrix salitolerans TaxID=926830 RepID=A0ABW2CA14_9PSEU
MAVGASRPAVVTAVVALVVTVLVLASAVLLRLQRDPMNAAGQLGPPAAAAGSADLTCGESPCGVLTSLPVGEVTVELLAGDGGEHGIVRVLAPGSDIVLETALADLGAELTQRSLVCTEGDTTACLVRGARDDAVVGEVFVARDDKWEAVERPYVSNAGYLDLVPTTGHDSPGIVLATYPNCTGSADDCDGAAVALRIFALDGTSRGCTKGYPTLSDLPDWPDINVNGGELRSCG